MNDPEWKSWAEDPDKLLVLLAGQSNMAGRGYAGPDDLEPVPRLHFDTESLHKLGARYFEVYRGCC